MLKYIIVGWLLFLNISCTTFSENQLEEKPLSSIQLLISKSKEMLEKSTREYNKENYQLSYDISTRILKQIDYNYQYDGLIDDTGMYLVLAEIKNKNNDLKGSSKALLIVLESRLQSLIYKEKTNLME